MSLKPSVGVDSLPDLMYIPPRQQGQATKPRLSSKIRGHLITAVAWNMQNTSQLSTSTILMGNTRGLIFEAELSTETGVFSSGIEKQWKQVYDLGKQGNPSGAITALEYHCVPKSKKYFIIAASAHRIYQFQVRFSRVKDATYIFLEPNLLRLVNESDL